MGRALEEARARGASPDGATGTRVPGKATQLEQLPEGDAGAPLPADAAAHFGQTFGHDLGAARIHTGPAAERAADAVDARAFARGRDIYVGAGESATPSPGNELIAHELAHVVQHERGEVPASDRPSSAGDTVEKDAHAMTAGGARPVPRVQLRDVPAPRAILRWQRGPTGALTSTEIEGLRAILTGELGLAAAEHGDLSNLSNLSDARIDAAIRVLRWLHRGSNRVTSAWGQHLDDIGNPHSPRARGSERYSNIIEFADALNQHSPGGDYIAFRLHMPQTRLAGWNITVNARALYFTAAAQVGMDERGRNNGGETGHGHWVPAGGFYAMFRDLKIALSQLAFTHRPVQGRPPQKRTQPVDGGVAIFATIQAEIRRMLEELAAQQAGRDTQAEHADEHEERGLRDLLLPRRAGIEAVPAPASDADVAEQAAALLAAIGDVDYGNATHEAGATDPHGTDHALGVAADMFDGNDGRNMLVPQGVWPFFHYLIETNAGAFGLTGSERPLNIMASPHVLRPLARLLLERGRGTLTRLTHLAQTDGADLAADHHVRDERHEIARIRDELRGSLRARRATLRRAKDAPTTSEADARRIRRELDAIELDLGAISTAGTTSLRRIAQEHADALSALAHTETATTQPVEGADPLAHVGPDEQPNPLSAVLADLAHVPTATTAQADRDLRHQAMLALATPGVREFVLRGTQRLFYDQPDTMVAAMEGVQSHDRRTSPNFHAFQGGHHWAIAPRQIVDNDRAYGASLARDINARTPAQLERILSVMAESDGGRRALFSETPDGPLRAALAAHMGAGELEAALARIRARVVTPYEHGGRPHPTVGDDLRNQLRDMGYYVAPPTPRNPAGR